MIFLNLCIISLKVDLQAGFSLSKYQNAPAKFILLGLKEVNLRLSQFTPPSDPKNTGMVE